MPHKRSPKESPARAAQNQLLWAMNPDGDFAGVGNWEPRGEDFTQAVLGVLGTGATLLIRPGSGGRAIGIAIWEGDTRHPATWCYDDEEVNLWAVGVLKRLAPKSTPE